MNLTATLLLSFTLYAPLPEEAKKKPDAELIQGRWKVVAAEFDGRVHDTILNDVVILKDGVFAIESARGTNERHKYTLAEEMKLKAIDLRVKDGAATLLGIYELDGDGLRLCFEMPNGPTKERPKEFSAAGGSQRMVIKLERERK